MDWSINPPLKVVIRLAMLGSSLILTKSVVISQVWWWCNLTRWWFSETSNKRAVIEGKISTTLTMVLHCLTHRCPALPAVTSIAGEGRYVNTKGDESVDMALRVDAESRRIPTVIVVMEDPFNRSNKKGANRLGWWLRLTLKAHLNWQ